VPNGVSCDQLEEQVSQYRLTGVDAGSTVKLNRFSPVGPSDQTCQGPNPVLNESRDATTIYHTHGWVVGGEAGLYDCDAARPGVDIPLEVC
jgi:hypothetical protein